MPGDNFQKASNWILQSGIQGKNGAFHAWFDLQQGKNSFEYSEITGYGIATLVFLNEVQPSKALVEKAERAFEWLDENAVTEEGAVLARNYMAWEQADPKFSFQSRNVFSFDTGMVLNGLMSLHEATGKQNVLDSALGIGRFLAGRVHGDGSIDAVYSLESRKVLDSSEKWSTQPGSYHAKAAIGLLKLAEASGEEKFREKAIALCNFALERQLPEGRFVTNAGDESTHLHPHCYSAEGLLFAGLHEKEGRFLDAAEKAVLWALQNQAGDGGVNALFNGKWNQSQRSDVLAQVLRLGAALKGIGMLEAVEDEKLSSLQSRLLSFQHEAGGFLYGQELDLAERKCVNAWCTMFALQALDWLGKKKIGFGRVI